MYDDSSDMIKLFSGMVVNLQLCPEEDRKIIKQILSEDFYVYAITGDLDEHHFCDELNLYATHGEFSIAKKNIHHMRTVWPLSDGIFRSYNNYMQVITIDESPVPHKYSISDLYITQEMEGFDKVVNRLITAAKIMLL